MSAPLLRWLERGLLVVGIVLGVWCVMVWMDARHVGNLAPSPSPPAPTVAVPRESPVGTAGRRPTYAVGSVVAKLEAPSVRLTATILEGTDDATLRRGAGHIEDTAFPGESGNVGIAGHRDTTFRQVRHLRIGDPLDLQTADRVYRYRISKTFIVNPKDVYVLDPTDHPTLTLVTCYPFNYIGNAPKRYIITADLIGEDARATAAGE